MSVEADNIKSISELQLAMIAKGIVLKSGPDGWMSPGGETQKALLGLLGLMSVASKPIDSTKPETASQQIDTIGGIKIYRFNDGRISFASGLQINADGSPHAYHPQSGKGLDYLANAGSPGNWWGIATDEHGRPYVQGDNDPAPGFYVSTTALENLGFKSSDPKRYVDSEKVNFIVIPGKVTWAKLGQKARVSYKGKTVEAIVADIGPRNKIGEGSIALALALGIPANPKTGGVDSGVVYEILP